MRTLQENWVPIELCLNTTVPKNYWYWYYVFWIVYTFVMWAPVWVQEETGRASSIKICPNKICSSYTTTDSSWIKGELKENFISCEFWVYQTRKQSANNVIHDLNLYCFFFQIFLSHYSNMGIVIFVFFNKSHFEMKIWYHNSPKSKPKSWLI